MAKKKQDTKQRELLIVMVLSILLGAGGGFAVGVATSSDSATDTPMQEMTSDNMGHGHSDMFMVSAAEAPNVDVVVTEDAKAGYNVKILTTNFSFAPESVNSENVIGEGHAHLYVDGRKIGRLYSPDFHYSGNFEGTKTFKVTLNANDHSEYAVDGEIISAEVDVTHDSYNPEHDDMHSSDEHSDTDN